MPVPLPPPLPIDFYNLFRLRGAHPQPTPQRSTRENALDMSSRALDLSEDASKRSAESYGFMQLPCRILAGKSRRVARTALPETTVRMLPSIKRGISLSWREESPLSVPARMLAQLAFASRIMVIPKYEKGSEKR